MKKKLSKITTKKKNLDSKKNTISKIWGGRFSKNPSDLMQEINQSILFDSLLYKQDILGSQAHA